MHVPGNAYASQLFVVINYDWCQYMSKYLCDLRIILHAIANAIRCETILYVERVPDQIFIH